MHVMIFFTLLASGLASLATAGDACAMSHIDFCTCIEYDVQIKNNTGDPGTANALQAIAATTSPRIRDPYKQTIVKCFMLKESDTSSLEKLASSLHRKWVDKLYIESVPMEKEMIVARFPSLWLKDARVKQFEVAHSTLAGDFIWKGNPFAGQEHTLIWFAAIDCSLTGSLTYDTLGTVNTRGLDDLPRLEGLDLSQNNLISIQRAAFGHTHPRLKTIVLSKNIIEQVTPGAFSNLRQLQHVDLSHNMISNISREIFSKESNTLRRINLSWNRLQVLPKDIFSKMPALRVVDVSNNYLYSMPEEPWNSIWWQLQMIDVSNNFVECDCELLWLVSNSTLMENVTPKRRIKGQCSRSFPSLLVRHYDLAKLTVDNLDCLGDDDDNEDDDDDYFGN
ncbi:peroxidasin-like [Argiope bruennichi]|uniref:Immunoglobulin superfamily containing n=1 Tax=Argiope bruennichi TaxID=94029 RepID=A0A8T0FVR2_ARGBR|nr:peroxidasin-like [Argiope bruennichi]KAF8795181.1 Immunoglobulin superfamily containing [Argiope bruennichi]